MCHVNIIWFFFFLPFFSFLISLSFKMKLQFTANALNAGNPVTGKSSVAI